MLVGHLAHFEKFVNFVVSIAILTRKIASQTPRADFPQRRGDISISRTCSIGACRLCFGCLRMAVVVHNIDKQARLALDSDDPAHEPHDFAFGDDCFGHLIPSSGLH
jgi:hypothetical protein